MTEELLRTLPFLTGLRSGRTHATVSISGGAESVLPYGRKTTCAKESTALMVTGAKPVFTILIKDVSLILAVIVVRVNRGE